MPIAISQRLKQIPPLWYARIITCWLLTQIKCLLKVIEERKCKRERGKRKTGGQTKSKRQRVTLSLSHLAVFQVINQVLPFSFTLLLPLEVTLTAHMPAYTLTHNTEGTDCVGIQRHMYSFTKLPLNFISATERLLWASGLCMSVCILGCLNLGMDHFLFLAL